MGGWGEFSDYLTSKIGIFVPHPSWIWQFCNFRWALSPESIMQEILQTFFARPRLGGIQFPDFLEATKLMDSCYHTHILIDIYGVLQNWYLIPDALLNFQLILSSIYMYFTNPCKPVHVIVQRKDEFCALFLSLLAVEESIWGGLTQEMFWCPRNLNIGKSFIELSKSCLVDEQQGGGVVG